MASTGVNKWEKYFSLEEQQTKIRNDAQLYCINNSKLPNEIIKKGELVSTLVETSYHPKMLICWNGTQYRVSATAVDKPISSKNNMQLKPDFFGIIGEFKASEYQEKIIALINANTDIHQELKNYLTCLVNWVMGDINTLKAAFEKIAVERKVINSVNKDFLEIIGPIIAKQHFQLTDQTIFMFPSAGNEPLYDFKVFDNETEYMFSSKSAHSKSTNLIKPTGLMSDIRQLSKVDKYKLAIEVLEIVCATKIKHTAKELSKFIKINFNEHIEVADDFGIAEIVGAEYKIINFLNSKLDYTEILNLSLPKLWFIKMQITSEGELDKPEITCSEDITNVKLRSKNSPGHYTDRIGFQL